MQLIQKNKSILVDTQFLRQENEVLESEIKKHKDELQELGEQLEVKRNKMLNNIKVFEKSKNSFFNIKNEIDSLREDVDNSSKKLNEVKNDIKQKEKNIKNYISSFNILCSKVKEVEDNIELNIKKYKNCINDLDSQKKIVIEKTNQQIPVLDEKYIELVKNLDGNLKKSIHGLDSLEKEKDVLQTNIKDILVKKTKTESENKKVEYEVNKKIIQKNELDAEINTLKDQIFEHKKVLFSLKAREDLIYKKEQSVESFKKEFNLK
jgi:chromosome segregation ATPase